MKPDQWVPFFEYLTSAAGGILAIAFVVFQLRPEQWRRDPLRQAAAIRTLTELATPVFFGLIFLMPDHPWKVAGAVVGTAGYIVMAIHVIAYCRNRNEADSFDRWQLWGIAVTAVTFSGLLWWPNLYVKASLCVWMIFSGFSEAWIFLAVDRKHSAPA
ncbi:MAG: hypothetical protein L0H41_08960 [Microlunatus sp.]|nr:hypothetical protein [Microlunatus sp.]